MKNKNVEVKTMEIKDLSAQTKKVRLELADLLIQRNAGKLTGSQNPGGDLKAAGKKRKEVARMLTVLRQKELVAEMETQNG